MKWRKKRVYKSLFLSESPPETNGTNRRDEEKSQKETINFNFEKKHYQVFHFRIFLFGQRLRNCVISSKSFVGISFSSEVFPVDPNFYVTKIMSIISSGFIWLALKTVANYLSLTTIHHWCKLTWRLSLLMTSEIECPSASGLMSWTNWFCRLVNIQNG